MDTVNKLMKIEDSLLQTAKELATVRAGLADEAEIHEKCNLSSCCSDERNVELIVNIGAESVELAATAVGMQIYFAAEKFNCTTEEFISMAANYANTVIDTTKIDDEKP